MYKCGGDLFLFSIGPQGQRIVHVLVVSPDLYVVYGPCGECGPAAAWATRAVAEIWQVAQLLVLLQYFYCLLFPGTICEQKKPFCQFLGSLF